MTKETYLRSVDMLLDAYNNGTLFKGDCNKCAVGTLLGTPVWGIDFCGGKKEYLSSAIRDVNNDPERRLWDGSVRASFEALNLKKVSDIRKYLDNLYNSYGFTRKELAKIEYEFEQGGDTQLEGLRAVLTAMALMVEEETIDATSSLEKLTQIHKKYETS